MAGARSCGWACRPIQRPNGWHDKLPKPAGGMGRPNIWFGITTSVYGEIFIRRLRAMGIRDRPIAPRSSFQNGHAERLIGSLRRECLDHIIVFGERHLRHVLFLYKD